MSRTESSLPHKQDRRQRPNKLPVLHRHARTGWCIDGTIVHVYRAFSRGNAWMLTYVPYGSEFAAKTAVWLSEAGLRAAQFVSRQDALLAFAAADALLAAPRLTPVPFQRQPDGTWTAEGFETTFTLRRSVRSAYELRTERVGRPTEIGKVSSLRNAGQLAAIYLES